MHTRSVRHTLPVLICPIPIATVKSDRKESSVSHGCLIPLFPQNALQGVERFDPKPQALGKSVRSRRYDHELLEIDVVVGVLAAVDDIHHRDRKEMRRWPAKITICGQARRKGRSLAGGNGDAEDRVRAEFFLVDGTIEVDHPAVDEKLFGCIHPDNSRSDDLLHVLHRSEGFLQFPLKKG